MFFEIENIGKVREARIEMRGITVLAGYNSTGKSTFGKALYCIFNAFCESDKKIMNERKNDIEDIILQLTRPPVVRVAQLGRLVDSILEKIDSPQDIPKIIQDAIEQKVIPPPRTDDLVDILSKNICEYIRIEDEEIQKVILRQYLAAEFEGQTTHVNFPRQQGKVSLSFKNRQLNLTIFIKGEECVGYTNNNVSIINRAFYMDTPFVMDSIGLPYPQHHNRYPHRRNTSRYNHRNQILKYLQSAYGSNKNTSEEVLGKQKLKSVLECIVSTVPGDFSNTDSGGIGFQEQGLECPLELLNVSAGMKPFLIFRRLLEAGEIKERDVLILDEPEIHLHPDWQIKFAEALVLLQKAFDLTILLTTHSPYFLQAIEVFSAQQRIQKDRCNYYYLENDKEGYCHVEEVTEDTDGIYQKLARPFQTLRNVHYAE